ncbi:hypothetical protein MFU01_62880 [Myxococcus fulvus]|uniref:Uncharacterized protein n=1 Tax=Myxococcus fulvus TaxID=33 RepID=A0A511TAQ0_MYXFU|nr:hypothetical protein MFU01_62880 [Myxococcus fulvus]
MLLSEVDAMKSVIRGVPWALLLLVLAPACSQSVRNARIVDTTAGVDANLEFIRRIAVARPPGRVHATRAIECLGEVAPGATNELSTHIGPFSPNIPKMHFGITRDGLVTTWRGPRVRWRPPPCAPYECLVCPWAFAPKDGERLAASPGEFMPPGPC